MNGYPYPVLTEVDSAYKADINFNIEFSKYACKDDKIVLSLGVELNSETLKNHIVEGNAKLVIKVFTGIRSLMFSMEELCENLYLEIKIVTEFLYPEHKGANACDYLDNQLGVAFDNMIFQCF